MSLVGLILPEDSFDIAHLEAKDGKGAEAGA
jgi:hypothetical protein